MYTHRYMFYKVIHDFKQTYAWACKLLRTHDADIRN